MNLQLKRKFIPKPLILLLSFYVFLPKLALASSYGSCAYGKDCLQPASQAESRSFFSKYDWLIFLLMFLASSLLLYILLTRRKKR